MKVRLGIVPVALLCALGSGCAGGALAETGAGEAPAVTAIAEFGQGEFLESVLIADASTLYVSSLQTGRIYRVDRRTGTSEIFVTLPVGEAGSLAEGVFCLAGDGEGGLYVNVLSPDPVEQGIWHVSAGGDTERRIPLPQGVIPNGIGRGPGGELYIADAGRGGVWVAHPESGEAALWSDAPLLLPRSEGRQYPAANGLQVHGNWVYVSISDTLRLVRIEIAADGSPGRIELVAEGVGADDFAVDGQGTIYATTHPFNSIERIAQDGSIETIAGLAEGVVGPTAAAWEARPEGGALLYVVNDGGAYAPPPSGVGPARLLRITLPAD
jgi:sugar lactone lactonase YvrE